MRAFNRACSPVVRHPRAAASSRTGFRRLAGLGAEGYMWGRMTIAMPAPCVRPAVTPHALSPQRGLDDAWPGDANNHHAGHVSLVAAGAHVHGRPIAGSVRISTSREDPCTRPRGGRQDPRRSITGSKDGIRFICPLCMGVRDSLRSALCFGSIRMEGTAGKGRHGESGSIAHADRIL